MRASTANLQDPPPTADLRVEVAERLGAGKADLPMLPEVATEVLALAGDPRADAARLSGLIHRDPSLAGQVLRIANSPAYMPRMPIVSLQQAVARLGLGSVSEIAFAASVRGGTFRVPGHEADLSRLWRHAVASGAFGKEIARIRRSNVESAFLCGLLHAIGKPAVLQVVADVERERAGRADRAAVLAMLDEHHARIGSRIAALWKLPRPVEIAILHSADYQNAPAFRQEATITCLADRLATDLTEPGQFDDQTLRAHPVFQDLNLYPDDVAGLLARRAQVAAVVQSMTA